MTATVDGLDGLFTGLRVRSLALANRFVMAPMTRNQSPGGVPDENVAQYYRRRALGETALIITEGIGIDHPAALGGVARSDGRRVPDLHGPSLAGWRRVVEIVHEAGGKIVPQLWHQGVRREEGTGPHPEAKTSRPAELTDDEILALIAAFGRSARNAVAVGFDGIEIHGAHGFLPDSFLWETTNTRTDRWGGDPRRRAEFSTEVVRAVRREIGAELPIFFRFSQYKVQDYDAQIARTPQELEALLGPIAEAGVDVFDASQRQFDASTFEGSDLNLAGWAKKLTGRMSITVGGVGLSDDLTALVRRFERGEFDLVAVGRALLQDPAWTHKARFGVPFEAFSEESRAVLT
jgi:2,4-dienoyl-CoA reductase-like NADH-dependent reductase (Old Yellow Enzyme family)